jgi:hypothetical protein
MSRQFRIRDFVQNILGCTCPDKVFKQIEDMRVASSFSPHTRSITIGVRLLVYIWNVKREEKLRGNLFAMLEAGRKERDERGLKRFRAVLAVDGIPQYVEREATAYLSEYTGKDDRIHVHVVSSADIKDV